MFDREEIAADQKAEYMDEYFRDRVTNSDIQDALIDLFQDDDTCENIAIYFRSLDEEEVGKSIIAYLKRTLKDDAEAFAEGEIEDNAERIRRVI
jgi:hypothetical protein